MYVGYITCTLLLCADKLISFLLCQSFTTHQHGSCSCIQIRVHFDASLKITCIHRFNVAIEPCRPISGKPAATIGFFFFGGGGVFPHSIPVCQRLIFLWSIWLQKLNMLIVLVRTREYKPGWPGMRLNNVGHTGCLDDTPHVTPSEWCWKAICVYRCYLVTGRRP